MEPWFETGIAHPKAHAYNPDVFKPWSLQHESHLRSFLRAYFLALGVKEFDSVNPGAAWESGAFFFFTVPPSDADPDPDLETIAPTSAS